MRPESKDIQEEILKASIAGDMKAVARLRADLAYAELPEQLLLDYHRSRMVAQKATEAFNRVKERVPEIYGVRSIVFDMLERNSDRLKSLNIE